MAEKRAVVGGNGPHRCQTIGVDPDKGAKMASSFESVLFRDVSLADEFFDSLKADYSEAKFNEWFAKKSSAGESALVYQDDAGLGAFVYLKEENEPIALSDRTLPAEARLKIGTLKVADRTQGERLGEGAIGLALWRWRDVGYPQVYITVFEKHAALIGMLRKFGFVRAGSKANGESVYLKDRRACDHGDPYRHFPFLALTFESANLLVVEDRYHDVLFPYSELANTQLLQESFRSAAANGVTKIYISAAEGLAAATGHPILVYRKYTGTEGQKGFKSVVTSFCIVTEVVTVKHQGREIEPFADYRQRVKNKSVFGDTEITRWYRGNRNLTTIEMVYLGCFGPGHNVNWRWLKNNGYWGDSHPHQFSYTPEEFREILRQGDVNVEALVADQS